MAAETALPAWQRASDCIELWMRGGEMLVNGEQAYANCFVVIEPGAAFRSSAPFGASALALGRRPRNLARRRGAATCSASSVNRL